MAIACFLPGEAERPQPCLSHGMHARGGNTSQVPKETPVQRQRGSQRHLLLQDDPHQRGKTGAASPQGGLSEPVQDSGKITVLPGWRGYGFWVAPATFWDDFSRDGRLLADELGIELLYLPSYAPNLNLIERLGKFVKKEVLSCRYYADFARFQAAIVACLNQVGGEHRSAIASLLTLKFQTFEEPQLLTA